MKEITTEKLRRFNLIMGGLHLIQGIAMLFLATNVIQKIGEFSPEISQFYLAFNPETRSLETASRVLFELPFGVMVASFLFISAIAHALVSIPKKLNEIYNADLVKGINKFRWFEYALSSSIMIVLIATLFGIYDIASLILIFIVNATMNLDDGQWHHYALVRQGSSLSLYVDGSLVGTRSDGALDIGFPPYSGVNLGRFYGPDPSFLSAPAPATDTRCKARFDRLRVWYSTLNANDIQTLHREDADHDGLWDVTEASSSLWRDTNSDAIRTSSEVAFYVDPFRYDPPGKDHDRDGITSVGEQTLGTGIYDADSDDDGIPDGYDQQWCAGAQTPDTNLLGDADNDGLTLALEIAYGSNPNNADSDGDGTNDGPEYAQGSHPNDASDGGQPPAAGATITMKLAVGDQSGSDSEDYHLVAYRYNPETRQETEVYRLRSGGFGQNSGSQPQRPCQSGGKI